MRIILGPIHAMKRVLSGTSHLQYELTLLEYDFVHLNFKSMIPLAKNVLRKLCTIQHPDVLKFMDVVESESAILIMTKRVC